ncbi:MAG: hypothetical protein LBP28_01230, partial [Coriobacteriales bacterium]|nr:hypothetical protein [Coriobacteriales bacterium]
HRRRRENYRTSRQVVVAPSNLTLSKRKHHLRYGYLFLLFQLTNDPSRLNARAGVKSLGFVHS